ncbi:MAG: hypothetical protein BZ133_07200 [Methanosphaera sp. SHI613]|jgi:hypothetical protein|nr:MAG: hypothetical protein BZ133_07200 [Methanosphaera sp. SHI613]
MKMEINIDPQLQRKARAVCRNVSGLTLSGYYEYLIELELKKLPSLDELEDDRPRMKSYNEENLDTLW